LTNNDVLRRIRYTFNFNDKKMMAIFESAGFPVTREQVSNWLKKDEDSDHVNCTDSQLAYFLNGFINEKRGKKDGPAHPIEKKLTNNVVLAKLKIALNLKAEDVIELLNSVDLRISKPELSAFFRKPEHKHYRQCKDQFLRNFLHAIDKKYCVERGEQKQNTTVSKDKKAFQNKKKQEDKPINKKSARPNAGKIYVNPNAKSSKKNQDNKQRKTLKLKPEDIWKD